MSGVRAGYHGRYLRVDLTTESVAWFDLPEQILRDFVGGTGLGAYLMFAERQPSVDPLSAESCLAFVFSPLVGSPLTTSAKFAVVSKSPLTQRYNDSLVSSGFAIAGKRIGADAIVITGRAPQPSVLCIDEDRIEICAAGDMWGMTVSATQGKLRERFDSNYESAVIGPAGERQVRYATISHDGRHAGRGGSGAVMGSKQLKALLVRGTRQCTWAHPRELVQYARALSAKSMGAATAKYRELGTASNLLAFNRLKTLPTYNFRRGSFAQAAQIAPETLTETRRRARKSCAACTIGCEHLFELHSDSDDSSSKSPAVDVRLEYESLFSMGSLCGIDDPQSVLEACRLCDEMGMDTISAGGTIAFAMECVERGWLREPWLQFGSGRALLEALQSIAARTGIGDRLAEGSRRFARELPPQALPFAAQVKGLELPGYEPRAAQAMGLGFAVGARGADHNRSGAYEADFSDSADRHHADARSVSLAIETEDRAACIDSLILCKFLRGAFEDLFADAASMLRMVCGWDIDADELRQTSRRIVAAKKLFNIQSGWHPSEDTLPDRFLDVPLEDDPAAVLPQERLKSLVREYNIQRHWTSEGWIPDNVRQQLRLKGAPFDSRQPEPS